MRRGKNDGVYRCFHDGADLAHVSCGQLGFLSKSCRVNLWYRVLKLHGHRLRTAGGDVLGVLRLDILMVRVHKTVDGCVDYIGKSKAFYKQIEAVRTRRWCVEGDCNVGSLMDAWLFCYDSL
jgi:hypothetical protein